MRWSEELLVESVDFFLCSCFLLKRAAAKLLSELSGEIWCLISVVLFSASELCLNEKWRERSASNHSRTIVHHCSMKIGGWAHPQRLFQLGRISGAGGLERNYVNKNIDRCSKKRFRTNFEAKPFLNFVIVGRGLHPNFPNMRQIVQIFSKKTRFYRELFSPCIERKKNKEIRSLRSLLRDKSNTEKANDCKTPVDFDNFHRALSIMFNIDGRFCRYLNGLLIVREDPISCSLDLDGFLLTNKVFILFHREFDCALSNKLQQIQWKWQSPALAANHFAILRDMQQFVNQFSQIRMTVTRIHCLLTRDRILNKEFFVKPLVVVLCGKLNGQQEKNQCGKTNCCREHRIENRRKNECGCFSLFKVGEWKHRHHTSLPLLLANNNANEKQTPRRPLI